MVGIAVVVSSVGCFVSLRSVFVLFGFDLLVVGIAVWVCLLVFLYIVVCIDFGGLLGFAGVAVAGWVLWVCLLCALDVSVLIGGGLIWFGCRSVVALILWLVDGG